jgi:hypothetical protein
VQPLQHSRSRGIAYGPGHSVNGRSSTPIPAAISSMVRNWRAAKPNPVS